MSAGVVSEFCDWLKVNGASFPKIDWPAINQDGIMGGIAKEDIQVRTDKHAWNFVAYCIDNLYFPMFCT